jgi:hypothetical protein
MADPARFADQAVQHRSHCTGPHFARPATSTMPRIWSRRPTSGRTAALPASRKGRTSAPGFTNTFHSSYRSRQRRPDETHFDAVEHVHRYGQLRSHESARTGRSAEDALLDGSLDEELRRALNALPEQFRLAVLLADLEGLSYRRSLSGSRSRLARS